MKNYIRHVSFFSSAQAMYGLLTFFYTLFVARFLGVKDFGLFQALLGFYSLTLSVALPLNFGALHCVASASPQAKRTAGGEFLLCAGLLAILLVIIFSLGIRGIGHALYLTDLTPVWNLIFLVAIAFLLACFYGIQQGLEDYTAFAWSKLAQGILCVVAGAIFLFAGMGISGALAGYTVSMLAVFVFLLIREKINLWQWQFFHIRKELPAILTITGIFWMVLTIDNLPVIFARRFLGMEDSGYFAALYNLRNTVWPFMFAIVIPFYSGYVAGTAGQKEFRLSFMMLTALGGGFMAAGFIFPDLLIRTFYGKSFVGAAPYMALYGLVLLLQMIVWLFFFYLAALRRLQAGHLLVPLFIFFAGLVLFERSISGLMYAQIAAYTVALAMACVEILKCCRAAGLAEQRA